MLLIIWLLIFYCSIAAQHYPFIDITVQGHEQYQDIIINNEIVKPATHNHTHCDTRYEIIKTVLNRFKRSFTMLDIGASQGYYSFRTAHDYPCTCVMVEANNPSYPLSGTQLLDLCKANIKLDNIILLHQLLNKDDFKLLTECEHFDVVLGMNIIHRLGENWRKSADYILDLGQYIIIETPPAEDGTKTEIETYLEQKGAQIIGKVPRHTSKKAMANIYLYSSKRDKFTRTTCIQLLLKEPYTIYSADDEKYLIKNNEKISWMPGINLLTFKYFRGVFPEKQTIKNSIAKLKDQQHNDWMINNMIIQGKKIILIDNPQNPIYIFSEKLFNATCVLIDIDEPAKIKDYFWKILVLSRLQKIIIKKNLNIDF